LGLLQNPRVVVVGKVGDLGMSMRQGDFPKSMFNSGQSLWYLIVVTIFHLFGVSTPKYVEDIMCLVSFRFLVCFSFQISDLVLGFSVFYFFLISVIN
jgi:hypothetical protein